ncbi:sigma 54-interacting transcriptional regulator [Clostridium grantii]|uniref:HTH-type transcriptional regulatory protein TyrR n=1 Tax=Clostridium grantii DSM 8605 TaxID=1121316 RepID=A0A1M5UL40_9CLOT|nr:sigma 54-interacting transcriptional regulator [Clostridium grantii]SHH63681.1 phosphotransferase system HPr (HPr) family [Clostridium grantii DSM 8605]
MYIEKLKILIDNGIHTRIAAMIVHKADQIKLKQGIELFIKNSKSEPIAISILALISLRIHEGEEIEISCKEDTKEAKNAVKELIELISSNFNKNDESFASLDAILEESAIANEQIIQSIPVGILVIDADGNITLMNEYGLNLIEKKREEVIGKFVKQIIPTSDLPNILVTKTKKFGNIQHINNRIVIANRSPIISNNKSIGAVGIFQDISELVGIKELNEKLNKILETTNEMICFVNETREITYVNPAYKKHFKIDDSNVLGKDLINVSPDGLRMKVFNSKQTLENVVRAKGKLNLITSVYPLFIDDKFKGVLSIGRSEREIKELVKKLDEFEEELNYYKQELKRHNILNSSFSNIIGNSSSLKDCLVIADKASKYTSTVLIRGESGTGKELIAKVIHNNSDRADKPFVRINCAAIPENLIESELFGYVKGAFTGAIKNKPGKFAIANEGTIFLDEIGDLPKSMQVKLLRVLQEKEFEPVGGITTEKIDVRIISATNKNLEEMMEKEEFREDLYYRLNVISIFLPPLRKRKEDINILVEYFINKISSNMGKDIKEIDNEVLQLLQKYHWPGNIRELENIIERAINMCDGNEITIEDMPMYISNLKNTKAKLINIINDEVMPFEEYEKEIIEIAMKKYGSFNKAGKALGLTHRTISLKCKKYGLEKD